VLRDLMKPVAMLVCSAIVLSPLFANIRFSDGLADWSTRKTSAD
jgi:hypothetical protein